VALGQVPNAESMIFPLVTVSVFDPSSQESPLAAPSTPKSLKKTSWLLPGRVEDVVVAVVVGPPPPVPHVAPASTRKFAVPSS